MRQNRSNQSKKRNIVSLDCDALRHQLEEVIRLHPPVDRVADDPIFFPRSAYESGVSRQAVEAVGLLSAMLAYGAVPLFMRVIRGIIKEAAETIEINSNASDRENYAFGAAEYDAFLQAICSSGGPRFTLGYRLSTAEDISLFAGAIGKVIKQYGGLWEAFRQGWNNEINIKSGLISLHDGIWQALETNPSKASLGLRHLLPNPAAGGCCKRWLMFLRWMVRPDDGVDLGLWRNVPPSMLIIPIDRHISRIARALGLTTRATDDWKTAEEITNSLKRLDPDDPIRFDFALCHLGISGDCTHGRDISVCQKCPLAGSCIHPRTFGKGKLEN